MSNQAIFLTTGSPFGARIDRNVTDITLGVRAYRHEQRIVLFRVAVWRKIRKDPHSEHHIYVSTAQGRDDISQATTTAIVSRSASISEPPKNKNEAFCQRFLKLPGEVRNQIYDILLKHQDEKSGDEGTPLFRAIASTKYSHAGATFTADNVRLPITPFSSLRYIGSCTPIWDEIFSRWVGKSKFHLVEAFEIHDRAKSLRDRIRRRSVPLSSMLFDRYLIPGSSQVFDNSNSWFNVMEKCDLKLHIFNLDSNDLSEQEAMDKLQSCCKEITGVLQTAKGLSDLAIELWLWRGNYVEFASSQAWRRATSEEALVAAIDPLKTISAVTSIAMHAIPSEVVNWTWSREVS